MKWLGIGIVILIFGAAGFLFFTQQRTVEGERVIPNGESSSPASGFPGNPTETLLPGWKAYTDETLHVYFQYPDAVGTAYIRTQDWPPKIAVSKETFSCKESGQGEGQSSVIQKTVNGISYCIENISQGAAGTVYTTSTYSFVKDDTVVALTFTLAYPQCDNYDDPKRGECKKERQAFDPDALVDPIARSVIL